MAQSIVIYSFLILSLVLFGSITKINYNYSAQRRYFWCWEVIFILVIYSVITGVRYDVGVDHLSYLNQYLYPQYKLLEQEFLFSFITNIFNKLGIHFSFYFGFISFIQLLFILLAFKDKRHLYPFLLFSLISLQFFFINGGLRQSIVCCGFVYSLNFISEKKFLKYLIFILIGLFIHKSVVFLIPLYFILSRSIDYFPNKWITVLLIFVAIFISDLRIWEKLLSFDISQLLSITGYDEYGIDRESVLTTGYEYSKGGRFYISAIIPLIVAFFSNKLKINNDIKLINILNLYFLGAITAIMFYSGGLMFTRFLNYFNFFNFIGVAYLLHYLYCNKKIWNLIIYSLVIILCLLYFYFYVAGDHHTQYKFFWDYM